MTEDEFDKLLGGNIGNAGRRNYFKPDEVVNAYVLLIEPTKYVPDARNPHADGSPEKETRRELTATITVFQTPEHLDAGQGEELVDQVLTQPYLAEDLSRSVGKMEIAKVATRSNGAGKRPSWVWRAAEGDVIKAVRAYVVARENALQEAMSAEDVPAWLKLA